MVSWLVTQSVLSLAVQSSIQTAIFWVVSYYTDYSCHPQRTRCISSPSILKYGKLLGVVISHCVQPDCSWNSSSSVTSPVSSPQLAPSRTPPCQVAGNVSVEESHLWGGFPIEMDPPLNQTANQALTLQKRKKTCQCVCSINWFSFPTYFSRLLSPSLLGVQRCLCSPQHEGEHSISNHILLCVYI